MDGPLGLRALQFGRRARTDVPVAVVSPLKSKVVPSGAVYPHGQGNETCAGCSSASALLSSAAGEDAAAASAGLAMAMSVVLSLLLLLLLACAVAAESAAPSSAHATRRAQRIARGRNGERGEEGTRARRGVWGTVRRTAHQHARPCPLVAS